jgi:hypothetical protein
MNRYEAEHHEAEGGTWVYDIYRLNEPVLCVTPDPDLVALWARDKWYTWCCRPVKK